MLAKAVYSVMRIYLIPVRSWEMMWNKIFRTRTQEGRISVTVMFAIATAICQIFQTQVAACFRGWQKTLALDTLQKTLCFYCKCGVICRLCIYCLTQSFEHSTTSLAYVQHLHQIVHYVYVFSSTSWCLLINVLRFSAVFLPAVCGTFIPPHFFVRASKQTQMKLQSRKCNKAPLARMNIAFIYPPQCFALSFHFHASCC